MIDTPTIVPALAAAYIHSLARARTQKKNENGHGCEGLICRFLSRVRSL